MTVLAIDPGSEQSAWVLWDGSRVEAHGKVDNGSMRMHLKHDSDIPPFVVIEWIASYGMAVGAEVFDTARWVGRFEELAESRPRTQVHRMVRRDVKLHLCGQARAKDANIRQALIDRFGGKDKAIGRKHSPGPLYGLKADEWQALALAVTFYDLKIAQAKTA